MQVALSSVEGLQAEASNARALAERHQGMVASLTADNLMFVMRLKKCEGDLVSAVQERDELRLAVEEQKGPWFDEVCAAVVLTTCSAHEKQSCLGHDQLHAHELCNSGHQSCFWPDPACTRHTAHWFKQCVVSSAQVAKWHVFSSFCITV